MLIDWLDKATFYLEDSLIWHSQAMTLYFKDLTLWSLASSDCWLWPWALFLKLGLLKLVQKRVISGVKMFLDMWCFRHFMTYNAFIATYDYEVAQSFNKSLMKKWGTNCCLLLATWQQNYVVRIPQKQYRPPYKSEWRAYINI